MPNPNANTSVSGAFKAERKFTKRRAEPKKLNDAEASPVAKKKTKTSKKFLPQKKNLESMNFFTPTKPAPLLNPDEAEQTAPASNVSLAGPIPRIVSIPKVESMEVDVGKTFQINDIDWNRNTNGNLFVDSKPEIIAPLEMALRHIQWSLKKENEDANPPSELVITSVRGACGPSSITNTSNNTSGTFYLDQPEISSTEMEVPLSPQTFGIEFEQMRADSTEPKGSQITHEDLQASTSNTQDTEVSSSDGKRGKPKRADSFSSSSSKSSKTDTMDLTSALEQNRWDFAFKKLQKNLNLKILPTPRQLGLVISKCLLKLVRVSTQTQTLASEYVTKLSMEKNFNVGCILTTLQTIEPDSNCYWNVIHKFLDEVQAEVRHKMTNQVALSFLKILYEIISSDYEEYLQRKFKLKLPSVMQIFLGLDSDSFQTLLSNYKDLIKCSIQLQLYDFQEPFQMCMNWINLLSCHICEYYDYKDSLREFVGAFVHAVRDSRAEGYGLFLIRKLKTEVYRQEIILFTLLREFPEMGLHQKETQLELLREISKLGIIRRHNPHEQPVRKFQRKQLTVGDDDWGTSTNNKGETKLHVACQRPSKISLKDLEQRIEKMKADNLGDINVLDYSGNTPLLECALNGSDDVIRLLGSHFPIADEPAPHAINVLAKDKHGNTALHLAAQKGDKVCINILIQMLKSDPDKLYQLLHSRNADNLTAQDVATPIIREHLMKENPETVDEYNFQKIDLSSNSTAKLKHREHLQKLIAYWRYLDKKEERNRTGTM